MQTKTIEFMVLVLIVLGSLGCSSTNPSVYYLGNKAYARNPETGKIMSWECKRSEGTGHKEPIKYDDYEARTGLGWAVCDILNCIVN